MSELSAAARDLIREGQSVLRPSALDRARVTSALSSRLGEGVLAAAPSAASVTGHWLVWQKAAAGLVGVGLVGLGAAWGVQEASHPAEAVVKPVAALPAEVAPALAPPPMEEGPPLARAAPPVDASAPSRPAPVVDRLAEEVSILSRATSELRGGRPAEALRLLTEHQRRFPSGRLVEERRAARIQALCALGNRAAAESELERLTRSAPRSPHLARAQQACGVPKAGG